MFDAEQFLREHFPGPGDVIEFLRAHGYTPPKENTVYTWFRRGVLPASWGYLLIALLERDAGAPVSLDKYVCVRGSDNA